MTRIAKLPVAEWEPELRATFAADSATPIELGPMRVLAQRPTIAKGAIALGMALKQDGALPERLIELFRLRIAFHNQCRSCMAIRYRDAVEAGVDEALVCSLEKPEEAPGLSEAERAALDYADRFATDHLSIDDAVLDRLRAHFREDQIVALGCWAAYFVGFGRLAATLDMVEELPDAFQARDTGPIMPWSGPAVTVR